MDECDQSLAALLVFVRGVRCEGRWPVLTRSPRWSKRSLNTMRQRDRKTEKQQEEEVWWKQSAVSQKDKYVRPLVLQLFPITAKHTHYVTLQLRLAALVVTRWRTKLWCFWLPRAPLRVSRHVSTPRQKIHADLFNGLQCSSPNARAFCLLLRWNSQVNKHKALLFWLTRWRWFCNQNYISFHSFQLHFWQQKIIAEDSTEIFHFMTHLM